MSVEKRLSPYDDSNSTLREVLKEFQWQLERASSFDSGVLDDDFGEDLAGETAYPNIVRFVEFLDGIKDQKNISLEQIIHHANGRNRSWFSNTGAETKTVLIRLGVSAEALMKKDIKKITEKILESEQPLNLKNQSKI